jgi:hypothetical protein
VITKFTKGEGKAMQKATVVPARWDRREQRKRETGLLFQEAFYKSKCKWLETNVGPLQDGIQ